MISTLSRRVDQIINGASAAGTMVAGLSARADEVQKQLIRLTPQAQEALEVEMLARRLQTHLAQAQATLDNLLEHAGDLLRPEELAAVQVRLTALSGQLHGLQSRADIVSQASLRVREAEQAFPGHSQAAHSVAPLRADLQLIIDDGHALREKIPL